MRARGAMMMPAMGREYRLGNAALSNAKRGKRKSIAAAWLGYEEFLAAKRRKKNVKTEDREWKGPKALGFGGWAIWGDFSGFADFFCLFAAGVSKKCQWSGRFVRFPLDPGRWGAYLSRYQPWDNNRKRSSNAVAALTM